MSVARIYSDEMRIMELSVQTLPFVISKHRRLTEQENSSAAWELNRCLDQECVRIRGPVGMHFQLAMDLVVVVSGS